MAVRPARFAKTADRQTAGTPPRLNLEPWPCLEVGPRLRRLLEAHGRKEQGSRTLRRLS